MTARTMLVRISGRHGIVGPLALLTVALVPLGAARAADLALKRVVLSSGGVGYYEYAGEVGPDGTVALEVPLDQVDDVLGSLMADSDGGRISVVELPGREPLDQYFAGRSFPQSALASPADLLNALVGAEIAADGPKPVRGKLVRVVEEQVLGKDDRPQPTRHRVSVLASNGLQQFVLEEADSVSFVDPALQAEVGDALSHVAAFRASDRRRITLKLEGGTGRTVRVGYVVEAPLWKTSYRLLMPQAGDSKSGADQKNPSDQTNQAHLQGWAVLENRSGNDWKDVSLTLVSGSPVTFRQALYQSYIVPRPTIPVDLGSHVLPMADRGSLGRMDKESDAVPPPPPPPPGAMAPAPAPSMTMEEPRGRMEARAAGGGVARAFRPAQAPTPAQAEEAPTQVSFTVAGTVSVPNGQSATLPIIDADLAAERVGLFQPATSRTNPLAAVTLKNAGASAWPPGMLTLYDQGEKGPVFAGNAQLNAIPPGESRFISYAVDLKTQIALETRRDSVLARIAPADGMLVQTYTDRQVSTYRLSGSPDGGKLVLEVARPANARLIEPTGTNIELTARAWRIPVVLAANEKRMMTVTVETDRRESLRVTEDTANRLADLLSNTTLSPAVRSKLQPIQDLRRTLSDASDAADMLEKEKSDIVADQERLRSNLSALPTDAALRRRYLDKLAQQETRLDALTEQQKAAADRVRVARLNLIKALSTLTV